MFEHWWRRCSRALTGQIRAVHAKLPGAIALLTLLAGLTAAASAQVIVEGPHAPAQVHLAAKEIRRYVYLRTGKLLPIAEAGQGIVLQRDPALAAREYRLRGDGSRLTISGGSAVGVLYGAYDFIEQLGVRFEIGGDVIPDERLKTLPAVKDKTARPLFELRGLLPFHDFPEGPDWWTTDEWLALVSQATKLRMNFIGLHTYPFHNSDLGPEPTVWVGLPEDVNPDGTVKVSDQASWYTTAKFMPYGCYRPMKTSDYSFGAAEVFPTDNYGPEVNGPDDFPMPKTPEARVALINRVGAMLKTVFDAAHQRGMKTCVGTEFPLDVPDGVAAQLKQMGMKANDPATLRKLYQGMFTRIERAYPIDYYWIWGHEGDVQVNRFVENVEAAREALKAAKAPFGLGICGWGWTAGHFPELDRALPKDVVFSAISMSTGHAPVSPNFDRLQDRQKWAIPWFEDDGALTSLQLRAGRMRRDAVDAYRYGCTGLMGLHWRTRIISPNIAALAQAGWDQDAWSQRAASADEKHPVEVFGGQTASFLNNKITGTDNAPIYQTVRYNLRGYRFTVPDGRYKVTLLFVEPAYKAAGKRVFGVELQGQPVIQHLDIFAAVGQFAALDKTFDNVAVKRGELRIQFVPEVEYPCIAAIELAGNGISRKVNCGGPQYQDYEADPNPETLPRDLPVSDFYADWATAQFGREAGPAAAAIFARLDGNFPATSGWNRGPGAILINEQPWAKLAPRFAFVDQFAALRPRVKGAGNLERYEWWLNTFRVTRLMGQFGCARGELDVILSRTEKEKDPETSRRMAREEALPVRLRMVTLLGELHNALLATLRSSTELGTLCNIEQQSMRRLKVLTGRDAELEKLLGEPLPPAAQPWKDYRGEFHLAVLNARTSATRGEVLKLKVVALDRPPVDSVTVHVRPLGSGNWQTVPARHLARAVFQAGLPAAEDDFEYYVEARGRVWPASAPRINQTVIVTQ